MTIEHSNIVQIRCPYCFDVHDTLEVKGNGKHYFARDPDYIRNAGPMEHSSSQYGASIVSNGVHICDHCNNEFAWKLKMVEAPSVECVTVKFE